MKGLTTVTTKGQVTIPYFVRQRLDIKIGDKVLFGPIREKKNEMMIKLIKQSFVSELFGSLERKGQKYVALKKVRKSLAGKAKKEGWG